MFVATGGNGSTEISQGMFDYMSLLNDERERESGRENEHMNQSMGKPTE